MEIDKDLYQEIKEYCRLNSIKDVRSEVTRCLRHGFNILKYGDNPFQYHNPMDDEPPKAQVEIPKDFLIKTARFSDDNKQLELSFISCDGNDEVVTINLEPNTLIDANALDEREYSTPIVQNTEDTVSSDAKSEDTPTKNKRKRKIRITKKTSDG